MGPRLSATVDARRSVVPRSDRPVSFSSSECTFLPAYRWRTRPHMAAPSVDPGELDPPSHHPASVRWYRVGGYRFEALRTPARGRRSWQTAASRDPSPAAGRSNVVTSPDTSTVVLSESYSSSSRSEVRKGSRAPPVDPPGPYVVLHPLSAVGTSGASFRSVRGTDITDHDRGPPRYLGRACPSRRSGRPPRTSPRPRGRP